jgi:acyl-homoserine-lactone acylase
MVSRNVVIEVRQPDGSIAKKEHKVWFSHYGPLLVLPSAGLNWNLKVACAKAHSVAEMQPAMKKLGGMPWVNTIAADRNGQAMYADVSVVPDVSAKQLKRCAPSKPAAGLPVLERSDWVQNSNDSY